MTSADYGRLSLFRDAGSLDAERARDLAFHNLEARGKSPDEVTARAEYLDLLGLQPGQRVLDVGCGSGVVTRDMARRVSPGGRAVGVDLSAEFLTIARDLAQATGLADVADFREGSALALPFGDAEFDVALAATVLVHVPGGDAAVPEMARVVRPGGRVGIFDFDGDSLLISHPDRALTRRIVAAFSDHAAVDGWLVRRLPGLLSQAGLTRVAPAPSCRSSERPTGSMDALPCAPPMSQCRPPRSRKPNESDGSTNCAPSKPPAASSAAASTYSAGASSHEAPR
jgi:SAM-dependent methyltransferase